MSKRLSTLRRRSRSLLLLVLASAVASSSAGSASRASICYGNSSNGRLEYGRSLPLSGANFRAYSTLGWTLGRTYLHDKAQAIVVDAYAALQKSMPDKTFVYGETGWTSGGRMRPHKTHRNGSSADLMVPVVLDGRSVPLPTAASNTFGYDIEFDDRGRYGDYRIDFEALGEHLYQLHRAADKRGIGIRRVIFEVPLQRLLMQTRRGTYLRKHLPFSTRPAWVRHDEHVHVDFDLVCRR
jgi:penicillin-insensitive murein DD-endopeptidase